MSDLAAGRADQASGEGAFRGVTVLILVAIGILAFVAMLLLGAYQPELQSGKNGGAHALSNAAVGYSGVIRLLQGMGRNPGVLRTDNDFGTSNLLVLTPEDGTTDLTKALANRGQTPTLVVLPKWFVLPIQTHRGWVYQLGPVPAEAPQRVLFPRDKLTVTRLNEKGQRLLAGGLLPPNVAFTAPDTLQTIAGPDVVPLITDAAGHVVLGRMGDRQTYVLADPDLISNMGVADPRQGAAAIAMLSALTPPGNDITFDVTLNGLGGGKSPLRLMFEPPFLAMTLAVAIAFLLAGWQALSRFGPARLRTRAIAFGKAALVDNSANLFKRAGREARLGPRYADVIRDRAVRTFAIPGWVKRGNLDAYLDALGGRGQFSGLAAAADQADDPQQLVQAARALHQWQKEKTR